MGTIAIVLTVKRNNCKTPLPEAASILQTIVHPIQVQIYIANTQQGAFTVITIAFNLYKKFLYIN